MKKAAIGMIAALLLNASFIQPSYAQCLAGTPCVAGTYTPGNNENDLKTETYTVDYGAGPIEASTCDDDFMNQIYARAFIEAERENVMAQTYIRKPDSVLQYSCIDSLVGATNPNAINLFSNGTQFSGKNIPLNIAYTGAGNPTDIDLEVEMAVDHYTTALNEVVMTAANAYITANFAHDSLGGTGGSPMPVAATAGSGGYTCTAMRAIWDIAKCQNFADGPTAFWTFAELAADDPRQFPDPGSCVTDITTELITTANNAGPTYPTALFDPLDTFPDLTLPATSDAECMDPVETGLEVRLYNFTFGASDAANPSGVTASGAIIPEGLCINPGCYYYVDVDYSPTPAPGPGSPPVMMCPDGTPATGSPPTCPVYVPPGECRDG